MPGCSWVLKVPGVTSFGCGGISPIMDGPGVVFIGGIAVEGRTGIGGIAWRGKREDR